MTMFDTPPKTITAMDNKELRQEIWRLKGIIDKQSEALRAIKHKVDTQYTESLFNSLIEENKRLRRQLQMQVTELPKNPEGILETICAYYDLTLEDIKGTSRKYHIVKGRHIACYVFHSKGLSYSHIGMILGNRDHSTMIHAKQKAVNMMKFFKEDEMKFVLDLIK